MLASIFTVTDFVVDYVTLANVDNIDIVRAYLTSVDNDIVWIVGY